MKIIDINTQDRKVALSMKALLHEGEDDYREYLRKQAEGSQGAPRRRDGQQAEEVVQACSDVKRAGSSLEGSALVLSGGSPWLEKSSSSAPPARPSAPSRARSSSLTAPQLGRHRHQGGAGARRRQAARPSRRSSMGYVLQAGVGQAPARQAALFAGLPDTRPLHHRQQGLRLGPEGGDRRRPGDRARRRRGRGRGRHGVDEQRALPHATRCAAAPAWATSSSRTR